MEGGVEVAGAVREQRQRHRRGGSSSSAAASAARPELGRARIRAPGSCALAAAAAAAAALAEPKPGARTQASPRLVARHLLPAAWGRLRSCETGRGSGVLTRGPGGGGGTLLRAGG